MSGVVEEMAAEGEAWLTQTIEKGSEGSLLDVVASTQKENSLLDNGSILPGTRNENPSLGTKVGELDDTGEHSPLPGPSVTKLSDEQLDMFEKLSVEDPLPLNHHEETSPKLGILDGDSNQATVKGTHEENSPPKKVDGSEGSDGLDGGSDQENGKATQEENPSPESEDLADEKENSSPDWAESEDFTDDYNTIDDLLTSGGDTNSNMDNAGFILFCLAIGLLFFSYYYRKRQSRRNRNQNRNADHGRVEHTNSGIVEESNVSVHDNRSSGVDLTLAELV